MGLVVVFMVLNVLSPAASAPAPVIFFLPVAAPAILPASALLLPAGTGALATNVLLAGKTVAVKGAVLAKGGIAALATAAAVTAYQQQQQEQQQ